MNKDILVIGGGGAKGSYAVGLLTKMNRTYDIYIGTSTGALIAPLVALGKYDELKEAYLNLNNDSIYKVSPFNRKGKLSKYNLLKRIMKGKNSLGESDKLKDLIRNYYTYQDHLIIQRSDIDVIITNTNMTTNKTEYFSANDYSYNEYVELIWTSTLAYPFTQLNGIYADGGYSCPVPVVQACKLSTKGDNIDIIVLDVEDNIEEFKPKSIMDSIPNIIDNLLRSLFIKDRGYAIHLSDEFDLNLNWYYTPYILTEDSMNFNKEEMIKWFNLGYNNK